MTNKQANLVDLLREIELGPAMRCLTEKQQNFVYAMIETGGMNFAAAARAAGYAGGPEADKVMGHRLAHDSRIQEAMREMGPRMLNAGLFIAARFVLETIDNPQIEVKDRLKAAEMVMNRTGMHATSEHKVAVTHKNETTEQVMKEIALMSKALGVDPAKLLGGNIVEAEFEEIENDSSSETIMDENDIGDLL
jgi:phage terminase small subunit